MYLNITKKNCPVFYDKISEGMLNMESERKLGKEDLVRLVKEIDSGLEFESSLGEGCNGLVLKVTDGSNKYRLKLNKYQDVPGEYAILENEFAICGELSKTGASMKPLRLYDNAPALYSSVKGKNAYLTEFIEGEVLSKAVKQSEIALTIGLMDMLDKIHAAGYKLGKTTDLKADNILLSRDGKLYMIDPMFLVPIRDEKIFGITREEGKKVDQIIRVCSY